MTSTPVSSAVAGRHLDEAPAELHDLRGRGALLRPEDRRRVAEARRDVAGDDELDPPQGGGRAHGLEGAEAAVGRRGAAAADHDAPRAGVAGGQEELAHAGGGGAHRVVAPWPREQRTSRGTGHLDDGGQGLVAGAPVQQAPLGLDRGARAGPSTTVERRSPPRARSRPSPPSDMGTSSAVQPGRAGRAGHGGGHLGGRCRPPELVRRGDQVGHAEEATRRAAGGLAVRARGFEPPPPFGDRDLNPARLPIPPRPQRPRQCG